MRRRPMLVLVGALSLLSCGEVDRLRGPLEDETPDVLPSDPPVTPRCAYCVDTAPATYTGPSNFWRGQLGFEPDCSDPTPLKGVEGFLVEPSSLVQFVRECRFTPSDTCATEGKVCAPLPAADFQTCIHHMGEDVNCPPEYSAHQEVVQLAGEAPVLFTLCCMTSPVPG